MRITLLLIMLSFAVNGFGQNEITQFFVDFGPNDGSNGNITTNPDSNGNYWINVTNSVASSVKVAMIDNQNQDSGGKISVIQPLSKNGINHGGLLSPSDSLLGEFAVATATQDYFFTASAGVILFEDLNPDKAYQFTFFGSRDADERRVSKYDLQGTNSTSVRLQTSGVEIGADGDGNDRDLVVSELVFPNSKREISLRVSRAARSFAYLNALLIEEISDVEKVSIERLEILGEVIDQAGAGSQLGIEVLPRDHTSEEIQWSVSNKTVGTVSPAGIFLPLKNGTTDIVVTADDGSGESASKTIELGNVAVKEYLVDFGNPAKETGLDIFGSRWNNISSPSGGVDNLKTVEDSVSNIDLQVTKTFANNVDGTGGLTNPDSQFLNHLAVPSATEDYLFSQNTSRLTFSNLNVNNGYRFEMLGSRDNDNERITKYTVSGANEAVHNLKTSGDFLNQSSTRNEREYVISDIVFPNKDGEIVVSVGISKGTAAYLNALKIYEYDEVALCEDRQTNRVVFMGSSVARGEGAPEDQGYAFQISEILNNLYFQAPYQFVNVSVGGDNTVKLLQRWEEDLLPTCGQYVVYGLSLGNEGIKNNGITAFDQYRDNMLVLIQKALEEGIVPVVANNYTREDFTQVEYDYIKEMNLLIHQWEVPSINLLGAIDDCAGRWVEDYQADFGHPNYEGHEEFSYAFVPSLFEALEQGKPRPTRADSTSLEVTDNLFIKYDPDRELHPFTHIISVTAPSSSLISTIDSWVGDKAIVKEIFLDEEGYVVYQNGLGEEIRSDSTYEFNAEITVGLSHYFAKGETFLYVNGQRQTTTIAERFETVGIRLAGEKVADFTRLRDWFIYRSAMTSEEHLAVFEGKMLQSSLDVYAPLYSFQPGSTTLENLAQSTCKIESNYIPFVDDETDRGFTVSPNPTEDSLVIRHDEKILKARIFSQQGRLLGEMNVQNNVLKVQHLPSGIYFLQIMNDSGVLGAQKFIKM